MCSCYPNLIENGFKGSDYIALIAIFVSIMTLYSTIRNNYKTKRIEIQHAEFDNICIKNIDKILSGLDKLFKEKELQKVKNYRTQITAISVELQCFVVSLKNSVYTKIDVKHFIKIIESFTDKIYNSKDSNFLDFKGDYYTTKLNIYNSLYEHAIQKEFRIRYAPIGNVFSKRFKKIVNWTSKIFHKK